MSDKDRQPTSAKEARMSDDLVKRAREYGDDPQDVSLGEWAEWSHKWADRIEELEAKLDKAVEELQFDYDTLGEINPSNYNHDDVCNLNDKSVEVIISIQATLAELTGGKDE